MNKPAILLILCIPSIVVAAETGSDFWKKCPGPACPADAADTMRLEEQKAHETQQKKFQEMDSIELKEKKFQLNKEIKELNTEEKRRGIQTR